MPADDLSRFCRQAPGRETYGVHGAGNLSVCGLFGKQEHICLLCCSVLAPLALSVLHHLAEGNGIRPTERLTGVHRDRHASGTPGRAHDHDEFVAFSPRDP